MKIEFQGWENVLLFIDETKPITHISHKTGATYSHTHNLVVALKEKGLLKDVKGKLKRNRLIGLTKKGEKVQEALCIIKECLK